MPPPLGRKCIWMSPTETAVQTAHFFSITLQAENPTLLQTIRGITEGLTLGDPSVRKWAAVSLTAAQFHSVLAVVPQGGQSFDPLPYWRCPPPTLMSLIRRFQSNFIS